MARVSFNSVVTNGNSLIHHITSHKLCVVILIQEYCLLKRKPERKEGSQTCAFGPLEELSTVMEPVHRRDFCMLILRLMQCPDMEYGELVALLESGQYTLLPQLVDNFKKEVFVSLNEKEVGGIMDMITNLGRFLIEPVSLFPLTNKSSPIGVFLRRVMLYFDKLSFTETVNLYNSFQQYVIASNVKQQPEKSVSALQEPKQSTSAMSEISLDLENFSLPEIGASPLADKIGFDRTVVPVEERGTGNTWSRRQAELFIAKQATLLENNEGAAMKPPQLQEKIRQVLQANSEYAEAHYLSYLNCVRVKEQCGAMDSLYHYFDRKRNQSLLVEDKNRGFRFAALNLALLHAQFGHKEQALCALREAITLALEANDKSCLLHAQTWLCHLSQTNKESLMEREIFKNPENDSNFLTSLGMQSYAQYAGLTGTKPALVLEVLLRSDVMNCQFSMMDLMGTSCVHKSALWTFYGKSWMASLSSQLLLNLNMADHTLGFTAFNGESVCLAMCNVANRLTDLGHYHFAIIVLQHAKIRFPEATWWMLSEHVLTFRQALYRGQWHAAHTAVTQIATVDKWESLLRQGELLLETGDCKGAMAALSQVVDADQPICPSLRVRGLLLSARCDSQTAVAFLTLALSISSLHYLDYLNALVIGQMANVQLKMGLPTQALRLLEQSQLVVLSHGGQYDQAISLLLLAESKVASVAIAPPYIKLEGITEAIKLLDMAKESFRHVDAFSKQKLTVYLQAMLCNEIGDISKRNKCALEFRQLDQRYPSTTASFILSQA